MKGDLDWESSMAFDLRPAGVVFAHNPDWRLSLVHGYQLITQLFCDKDGFLRTRLSPKNLGPQQNLGKT